jgi:hypothetical protein
MNKVFKIKRGMKSLKYYDNSRFKIYSKRIVGHLLYLIVQPKDCRMEQIYYCDLDTGTNWWLAPEEVEEVPLDSLTPEERQKLFKYLIEND